MKTNHLAEDWDRLTPVNTVIRSW